MATYTVKRNDNLFKIAQNLGLRWLPAGGQPEYP